jgi:prevent-host-death family protein
MYILMYTLNMKELSVTDFRRECLSLLDHLPEDGIVITKRGKPVARVSPVRSARKAHRVVMPLIKGKGKPGPLAPNTETPYDLIFD